MDQVEEEEEMQESVLLHLPGLRRSVLGLCPTVGVLDREIQVNMHTNY